MPPTVEAKVRRHGRPQPAHARLNKIIFLLTNCRFVNKNIVYFVDFSSRRAAYSPASGSASAVAPSFRCAVCFVRILPHLSAFVKKRQVTSGAWYAPPGRFRALAGATCSHAAEAAATVQPLRSHATTNPNGTSRPRWKESAGLIAGLGSTNFPLIFLF